MSNEKQLKELVEENDRLKNHLEWYRRTYEERSLPGVVKEKVKRNMKKSYIRAINSILKTNYIKRKYAVTYVLEYVRENGIRFAISSAISDMKKNGFKSLSTSGQVLRKLAVEKLGAANKYAPPALSGNSQDLTPGNMKQFSYQPKISVIFPTYNIKPELLRLAIESVRSQLYGNWELCIADDCSTRKETTDLLKEYTADKRIRVDFLKKNSGISEASNAAIRLATGDFIALMDHDDEITPDALYWIVNGLNDHPEADIIYTDECKVDEQGNLSDYFLKPDWSPELMINMMYVGHLTVYRRKWLLERVGLFRKEYDFSQDYDLMLRATEQTANIHHVKKVLYHWRMTEGSAAQGDKPYARITNLAALKDAARRRKINGEVIELPTANRLKISLDGSRKVSVVIPTDSYENLKEAIESIVSQTTYSNFEIVPVTNSGLVSKMKELFPRPDISYAVYDKPYNFSDKCNVGAKHASGEIVIFFNDDVRPLQDDWIENTIEFLEVPGIGGVSPKLIYENDTIQYAGMATGVRNLTGTTFHCFHRDATNYINFPQLVRNVSILSGACLAMRRDLFLRVGGFDPVNFPSAHSDVDLSFKILEAGQSCIYTPYAALRHIGHLSLGEHEKKQDKKKKDKADILLMKKWMKFLPEDPFFTEPMRNMLFHDSPEPFNLSAPLKQISYGDKGDVLLVSHDFSQSGAPIMLYEICKVLLEHGYYVVVSCPEDGAMRRMYQNIGVPVIVDALVLREHPSFERFARNFDFIICNTVVTWPVVRQMQDKTNTIWWIHEGQVLNLFTGDEGFVNTLKSARHLIGVSDYSISYVKKYNSNITKIYNACYDFCGHTDGREVKKDKVIFSLIGSIESRKGHDILVEALEQLPIELHPKLEVWIIGRMHEKNYLESLKERIAKLEFIKVLGEKNHNECLGLLNEIDVVLNVSRDDPFPVVLVEAMCMGKPTVVSSNSGVAELIRSRENGYVFQIENSAQLTGIIRDILANPSVLKEVGRKSRTIYEEHLTIDGYKRKLKAFMEEIA